MQTNFLFKPPLSYSSSTVLWFYQQIEQQKLVLRCVQSALPDALAGHVLHCLIKKQKLVVYTDLAVWASQLRFYSKQLLAAVTSKLKAPISTLQVRLVNERIGISSTSIRKARLPSQEKIKEIEDSAKAIQDEQLQAALLKLSKTMARVSTQIENL